MHSPESHNQSFATHYGGFLCTQTHSFGLFFCNASMIMTMYYSFQAQIASIVAQILRQNSQFFFLTQTFVSIFILNTASIRNVAISIERRWARTNDCILLAIIIMIRFIPKTNNFKWFQFKQFQRNNSWTSITRNMRNQVHDLFQSLVLFCSFHSVFFCCTQLLVFV